jgi:hypothetical protein
MGFSRHTNTSSKMLFTASAPNHSAVDAVLSLNVETENCGAADPYSGSLVKSQKWIAIETTENEERGWNPPYMYFTKVSVQKRRWEQLEQFAYAQKRPYPDTPILDRDQEHPLSNVTWCAIRSGVLSHRCELDKLWFVCHSNESAITNANLPNSWGYIGSFAQIAPANRIHGHCDVEIFQESLLPWEIPSRELSSMTTTAKSWEAKEERCFCSGFWSYGQHNNFGMTPASEQWVRFNRWKLQRQDIAENPLDYSPIDNPNLHNEKTKNMLTWNFLWILDWVEHFKV